MANQQSLNARTFACHEIKHLDRRSFIEEAVSIMLCDADREGGGSNLTSDDIRVSYEIASMMHCRKKAHDVEWMSA